MMKCSHCPCPETCLAWPAFCAAAARQPQEPVEIRHICERSRIAIEGRPAGDYPPVAQQAKNLFRSIRGWAKSGFRLAPKSVRQERLAICLACDKYDAAQQRCTICGCKNAAKVFVATDQCPLDPPKWRALP